MCVQIHLWITDFTEQRESLTLHSFWQLSVWGGATWNYCVLSGFVLQYECCLTLCPLSVSSPCKVSHSEGQGKACWVMDFDAWVATVVSPPQSGSVLIHSIRTGIQTHDRFFISQITVNEQSHGSKRESCIATLILRMIADPEDLTGSQSEHEPYCRLSAGLSDPSWPLFLWLWAWLCWEGWFLDNLRNNLTKVGMTDWHLRWHAYTKAPYLPDLLSEQCITNAHSCLCMHSLPVCLRADQPCHGETGGPQVHVPLCSLPLNAWSLQNVANV